MSDNVQERELESLVQTMTFGLHLDKSFDYDRHVRDHPFVVPRVPQGSDLDVYETRVTQAFDNDSSAEYKDLLPLQGAFMAWFQQFQPQLAALIRYFEEEKDQPQHDMAQIDEELDKPGAMPMFLPENCQAIQQMHIWASWHLWPAKMIATYRAIAKLVFDLPEPDKSAGDYQQKRQHSARLWREVHLYMPMVLPQWLIKDHDKALEKTSMASDTAKVLEQMSMMSLN